MRDEDRVGYSFKSSWWPFLRPVASLPLFASSSHLTLFLRQPPPLSFFIVPPSTSPDLQNANQMNGNRPDCWLLCSRKFCHTTAEAPQPTTNPTLNSLHMHAHTLSISPDRNVSSLVPREISRFGGFHYCMLMHTWTRGAAPHYGTIAPRGPGSYHNPVQLIELSLAIPSRR
jgi:hypothetical protein